MGGWRCVFLIAGLLLAVGCSSDESSSAVPPPSGSPSGQQVETGSETARSSGVDEGSSFDAASSGAAPSGGAAPGDYDPAAYGSPPGDAAAPDEYEPNVGAAEAGEAGDWAMSAPPDEEPASAEPPVAEATDDYVVRVFYATDREPVAGAGGVVGWRHYRYALLGGFVTSMAVGAGVLLPRKIISAVIAGGSLAATIYFGQFASVRAQQLERAAELGDRAYGSARHEKDGRPVLEMGVCEVTIPPDHRVGKVESPSVLRFEFREDPEKHVVLQRVERLTPEDFFSELAACVDGSVGRQAFVFVHGYNVGFDDAVKRTAQITFDLKFDGAAICYSWPSYAGIERYTQDEANVAWTVTQLETFLRDVATKSGARRVHLVAHSMGNRALTQAIERMDLRGDGPTFGQVVLAAPDVDAGEFRTRYAPALAQVARRVTLYASSNDRALLASTQVHGYTRAGLSGEHLVVTPGLDTVDVSPIDTSLIGHSYYGDNPLMIRDLAAVIGLDLPADGRQWLRRTPLTPDAFYWAFRQGFEGERL